MLQTAHCSLPTPHCLQLFPEFSASSSVRYHNCAPYDICHCKNLINLLRCNSQLVTFAQMIFYTIITSQHHTRHQSQHLLRFYRKSSFGVGIGIEVEKTVDHFVLFAEDHIVHFGTVGVKFVYKFAHSSILVKIRVCGRKNKIGLKY